MKAETKRFNIVLPKLQVESGSNGRCVIKVNNEYLFVNNWVNKRNPADKVLKEIQVQKLDNMRNSRY